MNLIECCICTGEVETYSPPGQRRNYAIDEYDNLLRVCAHCNQLLTKGKVALIAEDENGKRTGEILFLPKHILRRVEPRFPADYQLYVINEGDMRLIVNALKEPK